MQHIGQKYRRRTDDVQKRVLVGLQFIIFLMAVKGLVCGGEQLGGERLPRKDRRVLVLQVGVLVTDAAEARRRGHLPIRHSSWDRSLAQRQASVKLWLMWYFSSGAA